MVRIPKEDGLYFLCPRCGKFSRDDWYTIERVIIEYRWYFKRGDEWSSDEKVDIKDSELLLTRHTCGFETEEEYPDDFIVKVKGGKIIGVGNYWATYFDKLIKLVGAENIDPELLAEYLDKNLG